MALAKAAAAQKKLQSQIASIDRQADRSSGNIPSQYNGTLQWPMAGDVTQHVRVHRVLVGAARTARARHFHQGIDIVAPYGTPVHASGDGEVVYIGWNYADGAGSGLDRHHRPQPGPPDLVRPHVAAVPGRDPRREHVSAGQVDRLRGQHRALDRRAPALGGDAQRELRQPAAVPVATADAAEAAPSRDRR